jgi:hypothetical protein
MAKKTKTDALAELGDNFAVVLQSYVDELLASDERKDAENAKRRSIKNRAKKDGFPGYMLDQLLREKKMDPAIRLERHQKLEEGRKALKLYDNLFEYAEAQDKHTSPEDDADAELMLRPHNA